MNLVIEALTNEHGEEIIKFFKSLGYNTKNLNGHNTKEGNYRRRYYGVINSNFNCYKEFDISKSVYLLKLDRAKEIFKKETNFQMKDKIEPKKRGPKPGFKRVKKDEPKLLEVKIKKVEPQVVNNHGYQPIGNLDISNPPKGDDYVESKKEQVNHPSHYNHYPIEAIDLLISVFGPAKAIDFCYMTAMKYRLRLGHKDDINQDLAKEAWYLNKGKELEEKFNIKFTLDEKRD